MFRSLVITVSFETCRILRAARTIFVDSSLQVPAVNTGLASRSTNFGIFAVAMESLSDESCVVWGHLCVPHSTWDRALFPVFSGAMD